MIALGPFVLEAPFARGGMGEVWRGSHVAQGLPVAVKVLTSATARAPQARRLFQGEARAMAALAHPGIVEIYELGEVSAEAARASGDRLVEGSPYLVMELVEGARWTLRRAWGLGGGCGRCSWACSTRSVTPTPTASSTAT